MASYGQPAGSTLKQAQEQTVSSAIEDFDPQIKRATDYASRLETLCGRICGPSPTGSVEAQADQIPVSLIVSLNVRRSHFVEQLDRIERAINTIERVL